MEASAIYEPMLPVGWIGEQPTDHRLASLPGTAIPSHWYDHIIDRSLSCGIKVRAERRGFTVYDFASWAPGVVRVRARSSGRRFRTFGDLSEASKPALIQRLRVMNAHLTLLHAAAMAQHSESPTVVRVHERDLYRFDYPEGNGDGFWYRPLGDSAPTTVSPGDRARFGIMPIETYDLSLAWLDHVIATNQLISFDLLNQTQAALGTHDYAQAVVAAWTICELQVRQRASDLPEVRERTGAAAVLGVMERSGRLSADLTQRLHVVREGRNKWLHTGESPDEGLALQAQEVAVELLRVVIDALDIRETSRLLLL
jgi:hypothetical protein